MTPLQECHRKLEYLKRYMALKIDDRLPLDYPGYMLLVRDPFFKGWPQEFDKWYKETVEWESKRWPPMVPLDMEPINPYIALSKYFSQKMFDAIGMKSSDLFIEGVQVKENPLFPFKMSDGSECIGAMISGSQVIPIINKENTE